MLGVIQFGDYHEMFGWTHDGQVYLQEYTWRNRTIIAAYKLRPSGSELIGVLLTPYTATQKRPKR